MTNQQHPITPPIALVQQWLGEYYGVVCVAPGEATCHVATQAARWGADQELEACIELLEKWGFNTTLTRLRAARRPKSPSLKEQALEELDELLAAVKQLGIFNPPKNIRRALEALPND